MVRGQRAGTVFEKALDPISPPITDHGFNASTFTPASSLDACRPDLLGAGGALRAEGRCTAARPAGARHAGRDRRCRTCRSLVRRRLRQGHDPMGFGDRASTRSRDPRADGPEGRGRHIAGDSGLVCAMPRRSSRAPSLRLRRQKPGRRSTPTSVLPAALAGGAGDFRAAPSRPVRGRRHRRLARPHLRAGEGRPSPSATVERLVGPRPRTGPAQRCRRREVRVERQAVEEGPGARTLTSRISKNQA